MKICNGCGSRFYFTKIKDDKIICPNCYKYVFKNKQVEFSYRLKERLLRLNGNNI